jgi:hypothetical protein
MVDQNVQDGATGSPHLVLWAVPAEDHTVGINGVNVGPDRLDRILGFCQDPDVDAAFVVAVDEHDVRVNATEQFAVQPHQGRAILRLDDGEDVGVDVLDDLSGRSGSGFVGGFDG